MSKFRILTVDDEEDIRTVLRLALAPKYEVVEAHDGLDALEKLDRTEPDFVVLDVMMPLMDGYETCRAIRNNPKFREVPVLFLSAQRTTEAIREGYGSGADLYLTKPFDPDRLASNIEAYLQESRAKPRPKRYSLEALARISARMVQIVPTQPERRTPVPPTVARGSFRTASAPPRPSVGTAAPPGGLPEPPKPRVMVVDDERDMLELISVALAQDFEVTTAADGIAAVEKIILYQPDLIVLDAMLPRMSGYQLCSSLRRNQNYAKTPIVFVSAKSSPRDQEYCRRLGADDFLAKPFDPRDLLGRLLAYTQAPDFAVRPKKLTYEQIRRRERGG